MATSTIANSSAATKAEIRAVIANSINVDPSYSAAVNTAAIQEALDDGGRITINRPGTYNINAALVLYSDTHLVLGPDVVIKQTVGDNLLRSSAYDATKISVSSATWASELVTVTTSSAHGFTTGDWVAMIDCDTTGYGGVHQVTVTDTTHFTYRVDRTLTTPCVGTILCVTATVNVTIEGGIWDQDSKGTGGTTQPFGALLAYMRNVSIHHTQFKNSTKYNIWPVCVKDFYIDNVSFDSASDLIHGLAPLHNFHVSNISGVGGDDGIILMGREHDEYPYTQLSEGDMVNCTIRNVRIDTDVGSVVAIYAAHSTNQYIATGIVIENISGQSVGAVKLLGDSGGTNHIVNDVTIRNINVDTTGDAILIGAGITIRSLIIDGFTWNPDSPTTTDRGIEFDACTITKLTVAGVSLGATFAPTDNQFCVSYVNSPTIVETTYERINFVMGGTTGRFINITTGTTCQTITLRDCYHYGGSSFFTTASSSWIDQIVIDQIRCELCSYAINLSQTTEIVLQGCSHNQSGGRFLWLAGSTRTYNIYGGGPVRIDWSSTPLEVTGGAVARVFNPNLKVDVDYCDVSIAGQLLYNTDATNIPVGLIASDGTSWKHLTSGASWTP